jgi:2-iminobutanoate/2-iminopropanoate deaminase
MTKKHIPELKNVAPPIGPYNIAVGLDNVYFLSGQIPLLPETGKLVGDNLEVQTHQVMKNIKSILNELNLTMENIIKTTIFLVDMKHFPEVNEIYSSYFTEKFPARSTIAVAGLPKNALIEIECIVERIN